MKKPNANEICQEMNSVRCRIDSDVGEIADSVRTLSDWRYHARRHPWLCLAGAAAVGYFVVPKVPKAVYLGADALKELARDDKIKVQTSSEDKAARNGMLAGALGLLTTAAIRIGVNYVGQHAGSLLNSMGEKYGTRSQTSEDHEESHSNRT